MMDNDNGYGKLQQLLDDPTVSEIMINGPGKVFVERNGKKVITDISFASEQEVLKLVEKIYSVRGKRVDNELPYADVCMEDGTRINTIISPVSRFGISVTFRKFSKEIQNVEDLVRVGTINKKGLDFMKACIKGKVNMIFSGGTSVGKTTLLQMLSQYFSPHERVVTVEDSAELKLDQENVISLETKTPDRDGKGGVTLRDLISNSLRMSPDRLVVGEVRGAESIDMIQAMSVGHSGTIAVMHGNSPREVMSRLETMILMSGINLPSHEVKKLIASTIQVVVHMQRLWDGSRKVVSITEIRGMEGTQIVYNDLFIYRFSKKDEKGNDTYDLLPAIRYYPLFFDRMRRMNLISDKIFEIEEN